MNKVSRFLFPLIVFLSCSYHAWAEDEVYIEHARAGFSLRPKIGAWSGVTVHLSNPSNSVRDFEVVLVSQGSKSGAERVFCRRPVHMPPRAKRQERFYA